MVEQYNYVYNGSSLTQMVVTTTTTADEETTTSIDTLFFAYDASGSPLIVTYNGVDYYYTANIQGDIVGIVDNTGTQVVAYTYDAWGNILTTTGTLADTLGESNPLRYRGYVYDTDTGLFYLQSRYYNPEIGRFLNADALVSTGQGILGNNMFAYCNNSPVYFTDPDGKAPNNLRREFCQIFHEYWGGGGGGAIVLATVSVFVGLKNAVAGTANALRDAYNEVYEYSRMLREEWQNLKKRRPHVHHIAPVGSFSSRSDITIKQIIEIHDIMADAGINVAFDPINLMVVSAGTHARLHTDEYIAHVHEYLSATDRSREQVAWALLMLRMEIAAEDSYAMWY